MDQHPIPRQITSFEFKLIGFLTIKQFIYLVIFIPLGFIVYTIFPVPLLNILLGIVIGAVGAALAFLPINDRPLDVWMRNLFKRLTSPTQYVYHKQNQPLYFLENLYFATDPHRVFAHIESQEKLAAYLASKNPKNQPATKKQTINQLFQTPTSALSPLKPTKIASLPLSTPPSPIQSSSPKKPFFTGLVKNHKLIPLSGILIYVKDKTGAVLRLLKTNPHGVFATFNPLPEGEYNFEIKDPNGTYFFDTMKIKIEAENQKPLEFFSKELL